MKNMSTPLIFGAVGIHFTLEIPVSTRRYAFALILEIMHYINITRYRLV